MGRHEGQDYAEYIDDLRKFVSDEKTAVEEMMEHVADDMPEILGSLKQTLEMVGPDDDPAKSHWVVAQCRMILKPFTINEMKIKRYLDAKEDILKFDKQAAKMEAALGPDLS
jgi:vacuolar-type H+-ATPase catalytic subunit A/Vma1